MQFPDRNDYANYFYTYTQHLPTADPLELLTKVQDYTLGILAEVPSDLYDYAYAEGKWTIKELLQHIIDTEQILSYRALRFARGDKQNALPFEENDYVAVLKSEELDWEHQVKAQKLLRAYTLNFFEGLSPEQYKQTGSEVFNCTVESIAAIIPGHQLHHIYVLQERYLKQEPIPFVL